MSRVKCSKLEEIVLKYKRQKSCSERVVQCFPVIFCAWLGFII